MLQVWTTTHSCSAGFLWTLWSTLARGNYQISPKVKASARKWRQRRWKGWHWLCFIGCWLGSMWQSDYEPKPSADDCA
eukprot:7718214-Karenia_brevis.AAC.1